MVKNKAVEITGNKKSPKCYPRASQKERKDTGIIA